MIDIDDCWFDKFRSVAHLIKRLKFKREMTEFWRRGATQSADSDNLDWFENATEIHVVLGGNVLGGKDDFECWHGTSYEDSWPCDNVLFIDEKEGEEMWMMDLEYKCDRAAEKIQSLQYDLFTHSNMNLDFLKAHISLNTA
ncbi:unnamed protein product [Alternaria alternata]